MFKRRQTLISAFVAATMVLAACGGSSSEDSDSVTTTDTETEAEVDPTEAVETSEAVDGGDDVDTSDEPVATVAATPESTTTVPEPGSGTIGSGADGVWDGPDFADTANARFDVLRSVVGAPATVEGIAPLFEYPTDFPFPDGVIVGSFHVFSQDWSVDEVDIEENRIIGVDGVGGADVFDAIADGLTADEATRWIRSSSQRDQLDNDLFTALPLDGGEIKDRLILRSAFEPEAVEPPLSFNLEVPGVAMPETDWLAALPVLDGGRLVDVREGYGLAEDFGTFGLDGHVSANYFYPIERYDELEAFFASGVLTAAGFTHEDTPFSNFDIRVDVSNGDWDGIVGVGSVSLNGEEAGYLVQWSLTIDPSV